MKKRPFQLAIRELLAVVAWICIGLALWRYTAYPAGIEVGSTWIVAHFSVGIVPTLGVIGAVRQRPFAWGLWGMAAWFIVAFLLPAFEQAR
jgi:hypothetical protein